MCFFKFFIFGEQQCVVPRKPLIKQVTEPRESCRYRYYFQLASDWLSASKHATGLAQVNPAKNFPKHSLQLLLLLHPPLFNFNFFSLILTFLPLSKIHKQNKQSPADPTPNTCKLLLFFKQVLTSPS